MKRILLTVLSAVLVISCGLRNNVPDNALSIYLLNNKSVTIYSSLDSAILEMTLDPDPLLTVDDIDFYDWSSHCIYLKHNKNELSGRLIENDGIVFNYPGIPFIVCSAGTKQYHGYLYSMLMSVAPLTPQINEMSLHYYPQDILQIGASWFNDMSDARNNENVKRSLIDAGLLHAGISVSVDTAYGLHFYPLSNDTMQIEYRFTITNNDQDALYVIDPDKCGAELFFYFNNAPALKNVDNDDLLRPNHKFNPGIAPDTSDFDDLGWYTLLPSGESITRTVRSGRYTNVTNGQFEFSLQYSTPIQGLSKRKRNKILGRIWIGETRSPNYIVNYSQ